MLRLFMPLVLLLVCTNTAGDQFDIDKVITSCSAGLLWPTKLIQMRQFRREAIGEETFGQIRREIRPEPDDLLSFSYTYGTI